MLNCFSGIQTPKEDVATTSTPATTREEKLHSRTSGGCLTTGQQVPRGRSTTAGPSMLTSPLLCWTRAPLRLRSPPRTPALRSRGPWRRTRRPIPTGTTEKHKMTQPQPGDRSSCQSHLQLMDKSDSANHKLTFGKGTNLSRPFFCTSKTVLLVIFPLVTGALNDF